jgi:hypothetical protein
LIPQHLGSCAALTSFSCSRLRVPELQAKTPTPIVQSANTDAMSFSGRAVRMGGTLAFALAMPLPGPHIDGYLPMGIVATLAWADGADAAFWGLWSLLWAAYASVGWGLAVLLRRCIRSRGPRGPRD